MKIGFLDLNHATCGVHTNTVPLGSGLIATYAKKHIDHPLDIRMFKSVDRLMKLQVACPPKTDPFAVLGFGSKPDD